MLLNSPVFKQKMPQGALHIIVNQAEGSWHGFQLQNQTKDTDNDAKIGANM